MQALAAKRPSDASSKHARGGATTSSRRQPHARHPTDPLVLRRKPGCACGGGCPHCRAEHELEETLQTKLRIGAPDDRYEREADRVANEVMRMPEPDKDVCVRTKPLISPLVHHRDEKRVEELVQADAGPRGASVVSAHAATGIATLRGGGRPLPARAFFEWRFGRDFSGVRVHTGAQAAEAAQSVNARAFTVGTDVVFGAGEYAPGTSDGRRLLAHELTHVVQQGTPQLYPMGMYVQRQIGDLSNPRFSGEPRLEETFDNRRIIAVGSCGDHVRLIQEALLDLGFTLPKFGADCDFGSETQKAVASFQAQNGAVIDGVVGSETIGLLDTLAPVGSPPANECPPCPEPPPPPPQPLEPPPRVVPRVGPPFRPIPEIDPLCRLKCSLAFEDCMDQGGDHNQCIGQLTFCLISCPPSPEILPPGRQPGPITI